MRNAVAVIILLLALSAVRAFAVVPEAFQRHVPNVPPKQIEAFLDGVRSDVGPQEQRVLRDGLTWLEEYFQKRAGGKLSREQFLESLRGVMVIDVILHGYTRHSMERQGMIDDLRERYVKALTDADAAKTPEQKAAFAKEAERLKTTRDALVAERDSPSGLDDLRASQKGQGATLTPTPEG